MAYDDVIQVWWNLR